MRGPVVALSIALSLAACSASQSPESTRRAALNPSGAEGVDASAQALSNEPEAVVESPREAVTLTAEARRAPPESPPRVTVSAPPNDATLRESRVELRLEVSGWRDVASGSDLRHVVVALDDEPPRRVDDPSRPVVLQNLSDGTHVARIFLAWEDHESLVEPVAETVFHVGRASRDPAVVPSAPALVMLWPDGELTGDEAARVRLDFQLRNVAASELGREGTRVRVTLDGAALGELYVAAPLRLSNLGNGAHVLALQLVGPDGQPLAGRLQRAERRFLVRRAARPRP